MRRAVAVSLLVLGCGLLVGCAAITDPASHVGATGATLNAHGETDTSPATYFFQYASNQSDLGTPAALRTPTRGPVPAHIPANGGFASFAESIGGLRPSTTYYFEVCGRDANLSSDVCGGVQSFTTPPASGCQAAYSSSSPWNTQISANPAISAQSDQEIASLGPSTTQLTSDPTQYADAIYYVTNSTPLVSVSYADGWFSDVTNNGDTLTSSRSQNPAQRQTLVPIPAGTPMTNGYDGHVILINTDTDEEWDVSRYTVDPTTGALSASNIGHYNIQWSAVPPHDTNLGTPYFIRGSGIPFLAGDVRPCEIHQGQIDHAIGFAYPGTQPNFVYPATNSDGTTAIGSGMPMGSHLQLDPSISDATITNVWGCTGPCFTIAEALQSYGMFLIDGSGRPKLEMEYDGTANWNGSITASTVSPIPLSAFRVLQPPTTATAAGETSASRLRAAIARRAARRTDRLDADRRLRCVSQANRSLVSPRHAVGAGGGDASRVRAAPVPCRPTTNRVTRKVG